MPDQPNVHLMDLLAPPMALEIVREIAATTERVKFTYHVLERMAERNITTKQVLCCLRNGWIVEGPAKSIKGNWEMTLKVISAGDAVNVVIALDRDVHGNTVVVITTFIR